MDSLVPPLATAEDSDDTEPDPDLFGGRSTRQFRDEIFQGECPEAVPDIPLGALEDEVFASYSGPDAGLTIIHPNNEQNGNENGVVAGADSWSTKDQKAYGICISLYDQHPINGKMSGDPIADAFAIVARKNNCVMLIADGVNWGEKSKLAARCALYGSMTYIQRILFEEKRQPSNVKDALKILRKAVDEAHSTILENNGGLTTLCACLVCPVYNSNQYAVCTVNVGDSYAFVFSRQYGIREVTVGSHDVSSERDIRDAQGAIGPVDGKNPELNNLTCAVSFAKAGDVVFLTTDGISDNFDPVVTKVALPRRNSDPNLSLTRDTPPPAYAKPEMSPQERHVYSMKEMERIVHEYELMTEEDCSAQEICGAMVQHVLMLTDAKRKVLENPALYARKKMTMEARKRRDSEIVEKMSKAPGKLDHASLVAYEVGVYGQEAEPEVTSNTLEVNNDIAVQEKENNNPDTQSPNILSPDREKSEITSSEIKQRKSPMKLFFSKTRTFSAGSSPTSPGKSGPFKVSRSAKTPTSLPVTPKKYFKKSHSASESPTTPVTPESPFSPPQKSGTSPSKHRGRRLLKAYKRTVSYESNV